ncbi:helix-turn-helix domain-containing protein [Streptomyces sp. SID3343]|uniref:helix-turn-helix domain-containing protein n=1 Tax=Streptomyces sp. SID3343 TaxID=2690260 RepID=UPI0013685856|nr:helix-turn-helix domain-containing protein [Streptomyces sp. SID3343]MYW04949.1 helix-turn-helix domain-containing protein [Streptomyces sp. SID3343]
MNVAPALCLREGDRDRLEALARMSTAPAGLVTRARILLLAARGLPNAKIAEHLGTSRPTVVKWRTRYVSSGLDALGDLPRPGRPASVDDVAVMVATLADRGVPPARLAASRWSCRLLGRELGLAHSSIAGVWRRWNVRPRYPETFRFPTDPPLGPWIGEVDGLYLTAPYNAVVVGCDNGGSALGTDRVRVLPVGYRPPRPTGDDEGARSLSTALTAGVAAACGRPDGEGLVGFLEQVSRARPYTCLHVVTDDRGAAELPEVKAWSAGNPQVTVHRTRVSGRWLHVAAILLGLGTRPDPAGSDTAPWPRPDVAMRALVAGHRVHGTSFAWTKDASADPRESRSSTEFVHMLRAERSGVRPVRCPRALAPVADSAGKLASRAWSPSSRRDGQQPKLVPGDGVGGRAFPDEREPGDRRGGPD